MTRKRGSGEGSIYRRRDGRWAASLTVGNDANGRQRRRAFYAKTRREVEEKLARARAAQLDGLLLESNQLTVSEYLTRWLEDDARVTVRPTTYASYESVIRLHISPHLGRVKLSKLGPAQVQALYAKLEQDGASPRMRQYVHAILHRALSRAVKWELITRNPCTAVARPRAPQKEIRPLDQAQVRSLLKVAHGDPLEALYVLAVTTGLRQGEILALRWQDVDIERRTVTVRRTLTEVNGQLAFGEPKTKRGRRAVEIPELAARALRAHRSTIAAIPHPASLVFADSKGGPIRKQNLVRRSFRPLLKRAKLGHVRFHDLRHTAATLLLAEGVHPKVVQERLGHATISITLDTYSHVLEGMDREAANRLDAVLG